MDKRKAYAISLFDANAYIHDSESDPPEFQDYHNHHFYISGKNIVEIARMFDIPVSTLRETRYVGNKEKSIEYYPDIEIDHDPSDMYGNYSAGKVSALYVTIISANLCDIEVQYQPDSGESFTDKFTYSGAFCVGWRD